MLTKFKHKALWALKKLKLDQNKVSNLRLDQLNELDEFFLGAYGSISLYNEKMTFDHDRKIENESLAQVRGLVG